MGAIESVFHGDLVEDFQQFFAPASSDMIDGLIGQYNLSRAKIDQVATFMAAEVGSVLNYFIDGNKSDDKTVFWRSSLFDPEGAIAQLNADYWNRALRMTDVLDIMPQKRRDEWFEQIRNPLGKKKDRHSKEYILPPLPAFEEATVRATLGDLLGMRGKFFAERVDGLFRSLSGTHVTNEPQGFGKRMIIANVLGSYGYVEHSKAGYINDLRAVIAKFMGRDEPHYGASNEVVNAAKRNAGQWMLVDGGALRIRVYAGVGTAHLEVHPDMAWRLNCVLASLYPTAIPPKFRKKPERKLKDFVMMGRPLPFAVIGALAEMKESRELVPSARSHGYDQIPRKNTLTFERDVDSSVASEIAGILAAIGGVHVKPERGRPYFQFDYNPQSVIDEIVCSGCVPDQKAHQFYPTPESLAQIAFELAEIDDSHYCLEPSAGTGCLAKFFPNKELTFCVEISTMHCKVLAAQGFQVERADFLAWSETATRFDRVVMNPPFSEGRWLAHTQAAARLVDIGGRLVAILPASAKGKDDLLPGFECEWSHVYANEFAGTSVSVVILRADKKII